MTFASIRTLPPPNPLIHHTPSRAVIFSVSSAYSSLHDIQIALNTPFYVLRCLRNLSPSACPLCRKAFEPDRIKKLHVAGPPELDGTAEAVIEAEATQLLHRVLLVSGEDAPDVEIVAVVTEVEEWLSDNSADDNSVSMNCILLHPNEVAVPQRS